MHAAYLERLYQLFCGIVEFHAGLVGFFDRLRSGFFIQCTLDYLLQVRSLLSLCTKLPESLAMDRPGCLTCKPTCGRWHHV